MPMSEGGVEEASNRRERRQQGDARAARSEHLNRWLTFSSNGGGKGPRNPEHGPAAKTLYHSALFGLLGITSDNWLTRYDAIPARGTCRRRTSFPVCVCLLAPFTTCHSRSVAPSVWKRTRCPRAI